MIINNFRSNPFDKKYALLSPYILDETVRKNMLNNKDLLRKYETNRSLIKVYLDELDKRFDKETIRKFIVDTIFKFPDEVLVSFITAYLHSTEEAKSNINVVQFYNKVLHFGSDVIKYIEKNGIVTNRECKQLPTKIMNERFKKLDIGYTYRDIPLADIYEVLSFNEKQLLIEFMESSTYPYINNLFSSYFELPNLLNLLKITEVNGDIINRRSIEALGPESIQMITVVIFSILGDINLKNIVNTIKKMIIEERFDLIHSLLVSNMLIYAHYIDSEDISKMDETQMLDTINMSRMILEKAS